MKKVLVATFLIGAALTQVRAESMQEFTDRNNRASAAYAEQTNRAVREAEHRNEVQAEVNAQRRVADAIEQQNAQQAAQERSTYPSQQWKKDLWK